MAGKLALGDACDRGQRLVQGLYHTEAGICSGRPGKCPSRWQNTAAARVLSRWPVHVLAHYTRSGRADDCPASGVLRGSYPTQVGH